jgi:urocanate hydratase
MSLGLDDQCDVAKILIQRAAFDGEMAGSGAAQDPLFWVAHGAVERLLQKVIFENVSSDLVYDSTTAHCSGHYNTGTKYWLAGYSFEDPTIVAQDVTNVEFTKYMDPTTDYYRDLFNFVYDSSGKAFLRIRIS